MRIYKFKAYIQRFIYGLWVYGSRLYNVYEVYIGFL